MFEHAVATVLHVNMWSQRYSMSTLNLHLTHMTDVSRAPGAEHTSRASTGNSMITGGSAAPGIRNFAVRASHKSSRSEGTQPNILGCSSRRMHNMHSHLAESSFAPRPAKPTPVPEQL